MQIWAEIYSFGRIFATSEASFSSAHMASFNCSKNHKFSLFFLSTFNVFSVFSFATTSLSLRCTPSKCPFSLRFVKALENEVLVEHFDGILCPCCCSSNAHLILSEIFFCVFIIHFRTAWDRSVSESRIKSTYLINFAVSSSKLGTKINCLQKQVLNRNASSIPFEGMPF